MTWTVILPMFLRVMKNDFIVSRFSKAINKLKYSSSVFFFSLFRLRSSFVFYNKENIYFFVLTDFAICFVSFFVYISKYLHNPLHYIITPFQERRARARSHARQKVFRRVINRTRKQKLDYTFLLHNCLCMIKICGYIIRA